MLGKWLSKLCYVHVLEYLSAIKRNEILKHATKWINFKIIMLSGRFKKRKYIVWFQLWITKTLKHKNQYIETENILVVAWKWEKDKESWMGKITRTLRSYWYIHYFGCNRGSWCAHMWKLIKLIKTNQTRAWSLCREDSPRGGNDTPLQYYCLENAMGRGAWGLHSMGWQRLGYGWAINQGYSKMALFILESSQNQCKLTSSIR